jgi:hypothetical protein
MVISGLRGRLTVRVEIAGATVLIEGGLVDVSIYVNCGLARVIPNELYVPGGTFERLNGVAKSIREANSTVTCVPLESTESGLEPDCGVNVRPVIVTVKESTPQKGVSPPKIASAPWAGELGGVVPWPRGPLQPLSSSRPVAATSAMARM